MTTSPPPDERDGSGTEEGAPARRARGRPRDPLTDERITAAAADLLLRRGFDRTTVDEVVARRLDPASAATRILQEFDAA